jgi:hypothetical protein
VRFRQHQGRIAIGPHGGAVTSSIEAYATSCTTKAFAPLPGVELHRGVEKSARLYMGFSFTHFEVENCAVVSSQPMLVVELDLTDGRSNIGCVLEADKVEAVCLREKRASGGRLDYELGRARSDSAGASIEVPRQRWSRRRARARLQTET